jgi:copper homeostasis protein
MILEICVDSPFSALAADAGGADRIELCENLDQGGVTPSMAKIKIIRKLVDIPIFLLIRPRKGDFLYAEAEFDIMLEDIHIAKDLGIDGFVSGVLLPDGHIDRIRTARLIQAAGSLPFTFHRAFDQCVNPHLALEQLIDLGVSTILSSGGQSSAPLGASNLKDYVHAAEGRIGFLAGGGIRPENVDALVDIPGLFGLHASAGKMMASSMQHRGIVSMGQEAPDQEFCWKVTDQNMVGALVEKIRIGGKGL